MKKVKNVNENEAFLCQSEEWDKEGRWLVSNKSIEKIEADVEVAHLSAVQRRACPLKAFLRSCLVLPAHFYPLARLELFPFAFRSPLVTPIVESSLS